MINEEVRRLYGIDVYFFKGYGDNRDLHYPLRRQRKRCIRNRSTTLKNTLVQLLWTNMPRSHKEVEILIVKLEQSLREAVLWSSYPPSVEALQSKLPFALDVMPFEH